MLPKYHSNERKFELHCRHFFILFCLASKCSWFHFSTGLSVWRFTVIVIIGTAETAGIVICQRQVLKFLARRGECVNFSENRKRLYDHI